MTSSPVLIKLRTAALWLSLIGAAGCTLAHDWTSPSGAPARISRPDQDLNQDQQRQAEWAGLIWRGPQAGAPAAPSASHCLRSGPPFDVPGPLGLHVANGTEARGVTTARLSAPGGPTPVTATIRSETVLGKAPQLAVERYMADGTSVPAMPAPLASVTAQAGAVAQTSRQAQAVTAGVVDDNADFGAYLDYRDRARQQRLLVRDRDIGERYRLSVHDAAGRPVPDAVVSVHAGGASQPLWARTDAGGQVWLHPRAAGLTPAVLEVQVSKATPAGPLRGTALLRRGQRDALQVRLDANLPSEQARLDLVFLVDATGSMADEIDKLRRSLQAMAEQIAQLPSQPDICFALVAYRDRGDEFFVRVLDFTNDLPALQRQLNVLRAGGGGDYPEALNEALHTAVHRLSWRGDGATRMVLLVADAPPHLDYGLPWYDDDMQAALAKGIKLFTLAASGLDKSGEYIYRQLAQFTGGRFVFLTYDKATHPSSGPGRETVHDVTNYSVETLDKLVLRLVREELARRPS